MERDLHQCSTNFDTLKSKVKESFERIYACLKARELKSLRQLDVISKHCRDDQNLIKNYLQNIKIRFDNEPGLLKNINEYGSIDFENLCLDSSIFSLEEYISPESDHMYSYKGLKDERKDFAIKEAALRKITSTQNCNCCVNITSKDVSKQFCETEKNVTNITKSEKCNKIDYSTCNGDGDSTCECSDKILEVNSKIIPNKANEVGTNLGNNSDISEDMEIKKNNSTENWLNLIKGQTETEPTDGMEHSNITYS